MHIGFPRAPRIWRPGLATILTVLLGSVALMVPLAGPASAATPLHPDADSYVDASKPGANYGLRSSVKADASPARITYMRFQVTGAGQPNTAELRLYAASGNDGITVHLVDDNTWTETGLTYSNRPTLQPQPVAQTTARVSSGTWIELDVSSAVPGDGTYTFAVTTADTTAIALSSREGTNPPELLVPAPEKATRYTVTGSGNVYQASSNTTPVEVYSGSLKSVMESATLDLNRNGGGTVHFGSGLFDLGSTHFELDDIANVTFEGEGIDVTRIVNVTSEATDTEVFDIVHAHNVTIRDMTVSAGGPARFSSDAIDFDDGSDSAVINVKVTGSRGRGIVFDGKNSGFSATGNTIRDCIVENVPSDGIELLASTGDVIEGCLVTGVGGHGIQLTKASPITDNPNKQSDNNTVRNNTVVNAGRDGINVNSSDNNIIIGNTVRNSSQATSGRDGLRVESFDGISCNATEVDGNTLVDDQATPTQTYGLRIASANCVGTQVSATNTISGNRLGAIFDAGTGTVYTQVEDNTAPSVPTGVAATAQGAAEVLVSWTASTDDLGVTGYTVYRDGSTVGSVSGSETAFSDFTVAPDSDYAYTVDAVDAAGNRSAQSEPPAAVHTPPLPSAFTLDAEADTYTDPETTSPLGNLTFMRVDGSPDQAAWVRFTIPGNRPIASATLRIRADSNHTLGFQVRGVADNTWDEATLTYANRPAVSGTELASSGALTAGQYVELDLSSALTQPGTYSFALTPVNSTSLRLASKESGVPPQLAITLG